MVDKTISDLTAATKFDGTEKILVTQGANSRRGTTEDLSTLGTPIITNAATSYSPVADDAGKWLRSTNAGATTITLETSRFTAGDELTIEQAGAGAVTIAAGAGFTINTNASSLSLGGQYAVVSLKFISDSVAIAFGDFA